jgi:serine/threonine protein kinase
MPFGRPQPSHHSLHDEFEVLKPLVVTQGNFNAGVYKVRSRQGRICVEKRFKETDILDGRAANEINLLLACKHPNINEYMHAFVDEGPRARPKASLYTDICDLGSLNDILEKYEKQHRGIGEAFIWSAFKDLANAIGYMQHGITDTVRSGPRDPKWHPIIHRDIAPRNVFLQSGQQRYPRVILGDFGCGDFVELLTGQLPRFDPRWAPPEAPTFGPTSDVWSMGAVVQAMCRLDGPAERYGPVPGGRHYRGNVGGYSEQLNKALAYAMADDPRMRVGIRELAPRLRKYEKEAQAAEQDIPDWAFEGR